VQAALPESADVSEVIATKSARRGSRQDWQNSRRRRCSSGHATRALLLAEPASVDGGEITDKGYINQRGADAARKRGRDAGRRCVARLDLVSGLRHAHFFTAPGNRCIFIVARQLFCESFQVTTAVATEQFQLPCGEGVDECRAHGGQGE